MLQSCLTFLPEHAEFINEHCAKVCENGRVAIHNASGVMLSYLQFDDYGRRMAIGLRRANCRISILTMSRVLNLGNSGAPGAYFERSEALKSFGQDLTAPHALGRAEISYT